MIILESGHIYVLDWIDGPPVGTENRLYFVNREEHPHAGTQTQEVLRALIDRTQHCDNCLRWEGNDQIIHHLRMALVLHEVRALKRKTEKGIITPETVPVGEDGHFKLQLPTLSQHGQQMARDIEARNRR